MRDFAPVDAARAGQSPPANPARPAAPPTQVGPPTQAGPAAPAGGAGPAPHSAAEPVEALDGSAHIRSTGDPVVDAALLPLGALPEQSVEEHPAAYEEVHRRLQEALRDPGAESTGPEPTEPAEPAEPATPAEPAEPGRPERQPFGGAR